MLNIDGSHTDVRGWYGGLVRNHGGTVFCAYHGMNRPSLVVEQEVMKATERGLTIVLQAGISRICSSKPKIRLKFLLLGHVEKNSTKFLSRFSNLVREHIPPYYPSWLAIPLKLKDTVWEMICSEYVLPQAAKRKLIKSANTMRRNEKNTLRKMFDECDTDDERKKNCPKKTKPEVWVRFDDLTSTEEVKASRERNKINRSKMLTPQTTRRKGVFRVADEMMEVDPTITRSDSFFVGHTRSDGTFLTAFVGEKVSTELLRAHITEDKESYIDLENRFSYYKAENDARFENLKDLVASLKSSGSATTSTVNVERSRISTPLLRDEAVAHVLDFYEHIVATGRVLVLPGLQENEEAEYEVIVDIIFMENSLVFGQRRAFFDKRLIGSKIKYRRILLRFAYQVFPIFLKAFIMD
ncbi:hypothetical protein GIB67_023921 [Kingdonia uniflora]|uniref:Uncharacterized protein n=1 Tax=Kingdonia uniflora TaxID=39325 RepID=A0A7J7NG48_9MAGN|nr:hypothetical protein GIB67_023921 [Kingdonia uniflora]